MRMTILHKYMAAFLGLTVLVLVATLGLARWSFERGFLDYVNTLEQTRLERASEVLAQYYEDAGGSWQRLTLRRVQQILDNAHPAGADMPPIPAGALPPGAPGGRPPPQGTRALHPPTALYDMSGELIIGSALPTSHTQLHRAAVMVDGEIVGELRSALREQLLSPQETAFSRQQLRAGWAIGAAALLLALAASLLLARGMLSPIRRMLVDVDKLSRGDYSVRMQSRRTDELGDLMNNLDRLAATLDKTRESRQRWFADVSHELRTPVTVLAGELEAMRDGIRDCNEQQLQSLSQEVQRLRYLIDDLYELSVSDVGGLRYEFSELDLAQLIASVISSQAARAADQGLELQLRADKVLVNGDINRLDQLFLNLLTNSINYTDAPGRIDITVSLADDKAIIDIDDTSPGIDTAECLRLFEPLYRHESSRSRRTGGAGLGLAISRKVVEAHGGSIDASPSSQGGLHIHIELPGARANES